MPLIIASASGVHIRVYAKLGLNLVPNPQLTSDWGNILPDPEKEV